MFDVGQNGAARADTRSARRLLPAVAIATTAVIVLAAAFGAARASAAFTVTGWGVTPTTLQAGGHPNLNLHVAADAVAGDRNGDDLKSLAIDLPAGLMMNPQAVATPCTSSLFTSDKCPAATQIGTIAVQYRLAGATNTASGSVYSLTPDSSSVLSFGFVVRPSNSFQKFFFSSSKVSGLATVRSGLDADYGLSISIPSIPNTVRTTLGTSVGMTISDISINLFARSGSTQTGPYFMFNPTRCTAATSRATMTSNFVVTATKTASFTPTGCDVVPFDPTFAIAPNNPNAGQASGVTATITIPTADQNIQQSHISDVVVTLPAGTLLNLSALNAVPAVCTDAQLSSDTCPAGSQIGTTTVNVPFLPAAMTGSIYLTGRSSGFTFGYVLHGARGTIAILRGSATAVNYGGAAIQATFSTLPQVPFSSATLNFTSNLTINPKTGCGSHVAWGDFTGYSSARSVNGDFYNVTNCPLPPDTTVSGSTGTIASPNPAFSFASTPAGATFECRMDSGTYFGCSSPYVSQTLTDGPHKFDVRAVSSTGTDPTPASVSFTVDTTPPVLSVASPTEGLVISGTSLDVNFTAEAGSNLYCRLDNTGLKTCSSPQTYSNLASGQHLVLVAAIDSVGNISSVTRHFTVAATPVVTIKSPVDGTTLNYDGFVADVSATSPTGTAIVSYQCDLIYVPANYTEDSRDCVATPDYTSLFTDIPYQLVVTATDANGLTGTAAVNFTPGIPLPAAPLAIGGPERAKTTDHTPSFTLLGGDSQHPSVDFECAVGLTGSPQPAFTSCGSAPQSSFTSPTSLPNGIYTLYLRSHTTTQISSITTVTFTITDWATSFTATTTTQQAAAHPDLNVDIKPTAGQLRTIDMTLPKGLIGSLNSFPKCPLAQVQTAYDCPANTQVGTVGTDITITSLPIHAVGEVYLTEPQVPGDTAGLTIYVHTPLTDSYANVVIPLRLLLVNNSQQMRVLSNSIPVTTRYFARSGAFDVNFYVRDFALHLNGSAGSPFPLLTNPSSCAAGQFASTFGDPEQNVGSSSVPYQATGCTTVPFAPTFAQTFTHPLAGSTTGINAAITAPQGSSSFRQIRVVEPPILAPNYPAFGTADDRCPQESAPTTTSAFDPSHCPPQALVGHMQVTSPVLPTPVTGDVYLISKSPLPWFGVVIKAPQYGVYVTLVGATATPQVDPTCDAATDPNGFCQTQISVAFSNAPDLPVTSINFDLSGPARTGVGGAQLSGDMVVVALPGSAVCLPTSPVLATITPSSGTAAVQRTVQQGVTGC